jgi:predicted Abi (CAAX) family protease
MGVCVFCFLFEFFCCCRQVWRYSREFSLLFIHCYLFLTQLPNSPITQLPNYPITQFPPFSPHSNYPSRQYPNTLYTPVGKHFLKVFMSIHFGLSLKAHWYLYWLMFLKKFSILKNMILIEVWVEFHDLPQLQLKHLLSSVQNYFYITFRIYFLV